MTMKHHMDVQFISSTGVFSLSLPQRICLASLESGLTMKHVRVLLLLLVLSYLRDPNSITFLDLYSHGSF